MATETTTTVDAPPDPYKDWVASTSHLNVTLSPEATAIIGRLMIESGDSVSDVFRKALGLYVLASEAHRQGKAVGVAASANALESEFRGF